MELNYLRAFYEVAKVGKFSEAASRLNISQSALSRSVSLLEESEGVVLFDRSKSGVVLTAKGQQVFHLCEDLFRTEKAIENLCREVQEKCEGPLRFAATDNVINDFLVQPMHSFRRKFPKVVPSITSGSPDEIINGLNTSENEFALCFAKVAIPNIEYRPLRAEMMALVCKPEIWKECKSSSNDKTLKKVLEKYGYLCSIGALLEARPKRVIQELFGETPQIGLETNSQEAQKRFCLAGEGLAYLTRFMVKNEIANGELFEVPVEFPHEFKLWFAQKKGRQLTLAARTFIEHFTEEIKQK